MKIGVIGKGVVGGAIYDGLQQIGHQLNYYDTKDQTTSIDNIFDTEVVFICVPTNSTPQGTCDISIVQNTIKQLDQLDYTGIIAVKSTVIPGTTAKLITEYPNRKICFVPEFLRERSALTDFVDNHDVLIVGTDDVDVYNTIVACHIHLPKNKIRVSPTEAELAKYFSNVYNSLRVTFANGMFEVCKSLGADYQQVFNASQMRSTITPEYLRCSDYLRGFGGHCLPKDSLAFSLLVKQLGLDHLNIFDAIVEDNDYHIKAEK
jgi:UDPglucose 6-dehydrogenase